MGNSMGVSKDNGRNYLFDRIDQGARHQRLDNNKMTLYIII